MGIDFPIFFGITLQSILGNFILLYARGDESKDKFKLLIGYFLFFTGLSGSYLSGKSIWLPVFWDRSLPAARGRCKIRRPSRRAAALPAGRPSK